MQDDSYRRLVIGIGRIEQSGATGTGDCGGFQGRKIHAVAPELSLLSKSAARGGSAEATAYGVA